MTVGLWCLFGMMFYPFVFAAYAKSSAPGYDNRIPREFLSGLSGTAQRANWVQMNHFEVYPPFAAAVLTAHHWGAPQTKIDVLALGFVVFRIIYGVFYLMDRHIERSVSWFLAFGCVIGLFLISV